MRTTGTTRTTRTTRQKVGTVIAGGVTAVALAGYGAPAAFAVPASPPASAGVHGAVGGASLAVPSADAVTGVTAGSQATLRPGASGPQVLAVQRRLTALGYWLGTPDGEYGYLTTQAVTALQKVAGLGRDGVLGPRTRAALDRGVRPSARSRSGHVAEIDLAHQVLLMVDGGKVSTILNVSSGSGDWYTRPDGTRGHAVTPRGRFTVFRSVDGWDRSPLGQLYRPRYFNGGIAVHGYPSVPAYPASHGCVRVSSPAMDYIWRTNLLPKGARVWVY